ncbi:MAG: type II toxin-antitoxin system RelE/ParE family toxin [Planctomycetota bacterium]|nr:type II toxin-antitoxin system RelE/ParE family toxin [Planctomycetota bacterium]
MKVQVRVHARAVRDVESQAVFIAAESADAAERIWDAFGMAIEQVAANPGIGKRWETDDSRIAGVRWWSLPGFDQHLLFYCATDQRLDILRVIHGARDLSTLFADEFDRD